MRLSRTVLALAFLALPALLPAAAAAPSGTQSPASGEATYRRFGYLGKTLTVEVVADARGVVRVIRGEQAIVEVVGRAGSSLVGIGLDDVRGGRLTLATLGTAPAEYLLTVPGDVRVEVRLPGAAAAATPGTLERVATYRWGGSAPSEPGARE
jgi:hypothetical protein